MLATGGIGKSFKVTSNSWEYTGDGHALALRAGASLINMEFVQFHPTGMVWPPSVKGLLVTESVRGDGGVLRNSEGKRFMFDYIPEFFRTETADTEEEADRWYDDKKNNRRPPELLPRDEVARAINSEIKAGRGSPHGGIFLDIASRRDADFIRKRLPSMYHQFKELADVDITAEPMEIGPTCHYVMGGVEVDPDTELSSVTGLYAVGECSGGMHGSNRLGGNSLSDLLVFGRRAGEAAAAYASGLEQRPAVSDEAVRAGQWDALAPFQAEGGDNPYTIQQDLQQTMNDLVGIIRTAPELEDALARIEALKERAATMSVEGHRQYNPGWHLALDLRNMLVVSEAIAKAALAREESRGGHTRDDFPKPSPEWGDQEPRGAPRRGPHRRHAHRAAAAGDARRAQAVLRRGRDGRREVAMGYDLKLRVWRGDETGGELRDYTVEVSEGEVVLDALHRVQATQSGDLAIRWNCKAGKCGSCSAEINGRPAAALHDPALGLRGVRDDHGHADADVPGDPRPGHRRVLQLQEGAAAAGRRAGAARRRRQAADDAGRRRARPGVPQVHRVLPLPGRLPRRPGPRGQQGGLRRTRASSCATPSSTCTRSTPTTGASSPRRRPASGCATSPSAAPRSARRASRSPTTRSSR